MGPQVLIEGLLFYVELVILLTFHEFGHAWMAMKCGDDTAKSEGRVSLNPLVHIDPIGTVVMPLLMIFTSGSISRFMIGWAKPVPVNPYNLRNPKVDDFLVTMAGPWMNLLLAILLVGIARVGQFVHSPSLVEVGLNMATMSLMLCFFNLIPIPPLDGSQIVRILIGMSYETYLQIARFGFILIIVVLNIPFVRKALSDVTLKSLEIIGGWFGVV